MIIGTYAKTPDGGLQGDIATAGLHLTSVDFEAADKGPDFRISADDRGIGFEIGAAWHKTSDYGLYLSVKLDSPVFAEPIDATLALKPNDAGQYDLRRHRPKTRTES